MKGISYLTDSKNRKKSVVIDLKLLEAYNEHIEDLFDIIVAEAREDDEDVPFEEAIKELKKAGKW
ncbi:MAG: hypothetical protein ABI388_07885 [Bacteroidia bacterium]